MNCESTLFIAVISSANTVKIQWLEHFRGYEEFIGIYALMYDSSAIAER
jgi:hypothetical protein